MRFNSTIRIGLDAFRHKRSRRQAPVAVPLAQLAPKASFPAALHLHSSLDYFFVNGQESPARG